MTRPLLFFLLLTLLQGAGSRWYGNYGQARNEAIKERKTLLVYLISVEEKQNPGLIRQIASDINVSHRFFQRFVPVVLLSDSRSRYPIELYYGTVLPALFFMDPVREVPLRPMLAGPKLMDDLKRILE